MSTGADVEGLLRELAPQVLAVLVRRFGDFADAEDAVQEALLAAATQWPDQGLPHNPRGWLVTVAARLGDPARPARPPPTSGPRGCAPSCTCST